MINGAGMAVRTVGKTKKRKESWKWREKNKTQQKKPKTKMDHKMDLINLDFEPPSLTNPVQRKKRK